jgi:ribosomal protein S12 methylthiotransferase accessory factor
MSITGLLSPYGVVSGLSTRRPLRGVPEFLCVSGSAGGLLLDRGSHSPVRKSHNGSGRILGDPDLARLVALAECAERYASCVGLRAEPVWASAAELGPRALDTSRIPRCSEQEYAHPACGLVPFDPAARIRWVSGFDLLTGEERLVPAAMASYSLPPAVPAEQFACRISTGHAVHADYVRALVGGICEVIERDAIELVWSQRLRLPLVPERLWTPPARRLMDWSRRHHIEALLFDATSDLGVPTVYCLQAARHDAKLAHVVACATAATLGEAAEKALCEVVSLRDLLHTDDPIPEPDGFREIVDGARYMAVRERAEAFDFLHAAAAASQPSNYEPAELPEDPAECLKHLVRVLREKDMQAVAVDHTTPDLRAVGLYAVSVVIPELQPMSLKPFSRFRAHPRLYTGPAAMGHPVHAEADLNPWPQPFA